MAGQELGVIAVGNALVDVLAKVEDSFIDAQGDKLEKGAMTLIDDKRALELYNDMPPAIETSGGSAANTMAGFASFGGKGGFIGKVADDELGQVFQHDIRSLGLSFETQPLIIGAPTGRCLILVTPDAQRTMNTFLGASVEMGADDIEKEAIQSAAITYLEGYLFDKDEAKAAFRAAAKFAHEGGKKVALTLSDPFCVDRHRSDFLNLVEHDVDILFANEEEIKSLYMQQDFDAALQAVKDMCQIACVTRGAQGATIIGNGEVVDVPATPMGDIVDTTGAGDQFAAGFLYGYTEGMSLEECGRLGCLAAGEVIGHLGPRPQMSYAELLKKNAA